MTIENLQPLYTTREEIERLTSAAFADLIIEDIPGETLSEEDAAQIFEDICSRATDRCNLDLEVWYDPEDLVTNRWVRNAATVLGAYYLFQRRGNPTILQSEYEEVKEILNSIRLGNRQLPRLAQRADLTPSMSNLIVDDRYVTRKMRVQTDISTGGQSSDQDPSHIYPTDGL